MIPDDEPTGQPPDSVEAINTYVVNEKTTKIRPPPSTCLATLHYRPKMERYPKERKQK